MGRSFLNYLKNLSFAFCQYSFTSFTVITPIPLHWTQARFEPRVLPTPLQIGHTSTGSVTLTYPFPRQGVQVILVPFYLPFRLAKNFSPSGVISYPVIAVPLMHPFFHKDLQSTAAYSAEKPISLPISSGLAFSNS